MRNSLTSIITQCSHGGGIGGGGTSSIMSPNNNGISQFGQMESSNSSTSNLSLKHKLNLSPQQQVHLIYNGSHKNLQKCKSSPMNSFINNNLKKHQNVNSTTALQINQSKSKNAYMNQNSPYREMSSADDTQQIIINQVVIDQFRYIYKSNSQKSINWEDTPQNQTHRCINNKNTGSQSHHSLFGSQGKGKGIINNCSKKMLMPSGSSGTLLRKEIIEMDEVNSSSSSSIGREENVNQAFNASSKMKKIGKLNFTGKPFAPDSIFINNMGKNNGDEDDTAVEHEQLQGYVVKNSREIIKDNEKVPSSKQDSKSTFAYAKNYNTVSNQSNQGQQQQLKHQKVSKQGHSRKNINHRNISPQNQKFKFQVVTGQQQSRKDQGQKLSLGGQYHNQVSGGRQSMGFANSQLSVPTTSETLNRKVMHKLKTTSATSTKYSPNHHHNSNQPHTSHNLQELNRMTMKLSNQTQAEGGVTDLSKLSLSQTQKVRISFLEQSNHMNTLNNLHSSTKVSGDTTGIITSMATIGQQNYNKHSQNTLAGFKQSKTSAQKQSQQVTSKNGRPKSKQQNDQMSFLKVSNHTSSQYSSNQVITSSASQFSSKSPAEKMFESGLLSQSVSGNKNNLATKHNKLLAQDLIYGVSTQILTPSRQQLQQSSRKNTGVDGSQQKAIITQMKYGQQHLKQNQISSGKKNAKVNKGGKAKNSSLDQDLSNNEEIQSPNMGNKMRKLYGYSKMKGDQNNFNEISESIIEENVEKFPDDYDDYIKMSTNNFKRSQLKDLNEHHNIYLDSYRMSPSKSNKVPNSLAFKRSSNDQSRELMDSQVVKQPLVSSELTKQHLKSIEYDEELNYIYTQRKPYEATMFTLNDKQELKRSIANFSNLNFSNNHRNQRQRFFQKMDKHTFIQILEHIVTFCDFELLLKIMSTNKEFREDFTRQPTQQQEVIFKIFKNQLRNILILGLPSTLQRIQYWNFKTKFYYGKKKRPNQYKTLKRQKCDENEAAEIKKDVYRTFPDMKYFQKPQKGQAKLFNILNAVAKKNSKTGYIQGMNFLAGTILINLQKGEETFWMMMSILNKYKFDSILDLKSGGLFQVLCYQLEVFIQVYMPDLADHFKKLKIPTDIYAANWFITMFCYELSMDLVFCIVDVFLLEGIKSLIRVSLALLKCLKDKLIEMNYEECMEFLSHCQKEIELDSQTLLETAFSFKITKSLLSDLELFYKLKTKNQHPMRQKIFKAFNRLSLQEEENVKDPKQKKYYWIILPATPDELKDLLKNEKNLSEEDIENFYQQNIKNRKLREIVEELQIDEDSEIANVNSYAIEKKDIQNAKMLQPSQRKKETLHSKYANSGLSLQKRKPGQILHFSTDSNNTIQELTNDFSKGGYSGGKHNGNNSSYVASNFSHGEKLIKEQNHKSLHISLVLKNDEEMLITPRKLDKISNDMSTKNQNSQAHKVKKENESPFIQIGSKLKSIFGNFFKTQDKLNKSYEETDYFSQQIPLTNLDNYPNIIPFDKETLKKQSRSKSIHQSVLQQNKRESPEIRLTTQTHEPSKNNSKYHYMPLGLKIQGQNNQKTNRKDLQKVQVTTEENHNLPNNQPLFFNTPTNLQQVSNLGDNNIEYNNSKDLIVKTKTYILETLRVNKQLSRSLERRSELESSVLYDEDEECDIDLLSQSADYTIQTVGDNIQSKRHQEFTCASKRPEILIAKDLIAGDEDIIDSQNYTNIDYSSYQANNNSPLPKGNGNSLSQTIKLSASSNNQTLLNMRKLQSDFSYRNSNSKKEQFNAREVINMKLMKSSPPVSPKDHKQIMQSKGIYHKQFMPKKK